MKKYICDDKNMPQNIDIEKAVLGALIIESIAIEKVINMLKPEIFYLEIHQIIVKTIIAMYEKKYSIDILTVEERLRKKKHLNAIGGSEYLRTIVTNIGSSAHIGYHIRIIIDKYVAREMVKISHDIKLRALHDFEDIGDIISDYHNQMNTLFRYIKKINLD